MTIDLNGHKRIAISGSHGCGKTFLGERLAAACGVSFIPEFARDLMEAVAFDWKKDPADSVVLFQKAIFYSHAFTVSCLPAFVSDRSVLDVAAYCAWHVHGNNRLSDRHRHELAAMASQAKALLPHYDLVLFYRLSRSYATRPDPSQVFIDQVLADFHSDLDHPRVVEIGRGDEIAVRDVRLHV